MNILKRNGKSLDDKVEVIGIMPRIMEDIFTETVSALMERGLYKRELVYKLSPFDQLETSLAESERKEYPERDLDGAVTEQYLGGDHAYNTYNSAIAVYDINDLREYGSKDARIVFEAQKDYVIPKGVMPVAVIKIDYSSLQFGEKPSDYEKRMTRHEEIKQRCNQMPADHKKVQTVVLPIA